MDFFSHIPVRALWLLLAAAGVVAGAPMFAFGLRTSRLRHALTRLREAPLDEHTSGLVLVRGKVSLEGPLFAPLSGKPCAGYTLEVSGAGLQVGGTVHELRPFRLSSGDMSARVVPEDARFRGAVTCERTLTTSEVLPERLTHLLEQSAEIRWLRDRRVTLRLVERALEVGAQVYVTGVAHGITTVATVESLELAATGTDGPLFDYVPASQGGGFGSTHPGLWIEALEPLEEVVVSSEPPTLAQLQPPVWSLALLVIGPLLTLVGLFYLARAAAPLMTGRL